MSPCVLHSFYGNWEIIHLFQIGLPNGLFITVRKCTVVNGVLAAWWLK